MRKSLVLVAALALTGCKQAPQLPSIISPYRIDIQQGNVVTQEMVSKLKAGMTRSQVRFVLGSPLVTDMFHGDRWDYVYLMQKQGRPDERRRLTVIFDGDKMASVEGDVVLSDKGLEPAARPDAPAAKPAASATPPAKPAVAPVPALKPEAAKPALKPPVAATPTPDATAPSAAQTPIPLAPSPAAREQPQDEAKPATDPNAAKPDPVKSDETKPAPKTDALKTDPAKAEGTAAEEKKEPPKRSGFGRMLDKIGF
jgi:outer membrane protein assembly factor BamE